MENKSKLKQQLRKLYYSGGMVSNLYEKLSDIKVKSLSRLSDKEYISRLYEQNFGKRPNLDEPKSYNEKLQWLKLNDHNPLYTVMVDKYAVKKYVGDIIGEEYIIPIVAGPWNDADEIDFRQLPEQYVLKCNHDCGSVIICTGQGSIDINRTKRFLNKKIKTDYFYRGREWPYKKVGKCIC